MLQTGKPNPNRNEQFEYINGTAQEYIDQGVPVISADTRKKGNIGNFKSNGQEYRLKKDPLKVLDQNFPLEDPGKTAPLVCTMSIKPLVLSMMAQAIIPANLRLKAYRAGGKQPANRCAPSREKTLHHLQLRRQQQLSGKNVEVLTSTIRRQNLRCYISRNWQGKPLADVQAAVELSYPSSLMKQPRARLYFWALCFPFLMISRSCFSSSTVRVSRYIFCDTNTLLMVFMSFNLILFKHNYNSVWTPGQSGIFGRHVMGCLRPRTRSPLPGCTDQQKTCRWTEGQVSQI
jgi:hypothetical protein